MFYYLNNFFLFSIFGYFFETILFTILNMHNESGFLHLWWTPFYGTGVIIAILAYKYINKLKLTKTKKNIILAIFFFIFLSLLELAGGIILELLHGYSLWSYNKIPLHLTKYISVPTSLAWTLFSFIYLYIVKKYTDKLVAKIPKFLSILLVIIYILDNIFTLYTLLHNRGII